MSTTGLQIVGFAGPQDSGKDECADELARQIRALGRIDRGPGGPSANAVRRFTLVQTLRDMADAAGLPSAATREQKNLSRPEFGGATGRGFLLALGRTVRDNLGDEWLPRRVVEQARDWANIRSRAWAIVGDVRTPAEVRVLKEAGALLYWVDRPGRTEDALLAASVREACDAEIRNDGTLADLHAKIADLARRLVG